MVQHLNPSDFFSTSLTTASNDQKPQEPPTYTYSLKIIDHILLQIFHTFNGDEENKKLVCELDLAGKYKITEKQKSYGNRFYFVLEFFGNKSKMEKELYCFGLTKGSLSFVAGRFEDISFTENCVLIQSANVLDSDWNEPNIIVYRLGAEAQIRAPYKHGGRSYPKLLPIFANQIYVPPCGKVKLNEEEKNITITISKDKRRVIPFDPATAKCINL